MSTSMKRRLTSWLIASVMSCITFAQAQTDDVLVRTETPLMPAVEVVGLRDPQFIPYSEFFAEIEKFHKLPERNGLTLVLRVVPTRDDIDLDALRVNLVGDDYRRVVPVSKGGRLEVPYDRQALERRADFVFNLRSGSLRPEINVLIRLDRQSLRYADLMHLMQLADKAERTLMTFTQRLIFPHSNALALGFARGTDATVTINSRQGVIVLKANRRGIVGIERSEDLFAENPFVHFNTPPDWVIAAIAPRKTSTD